MRPVLAALALCAIFSLLPTVASAASAYDEVPTSNWSYAALDYLCRTGVLEGYPEHFFDGSRTLTRYEFAQAIARTLDTIDQKPPALPHVEAIVDALFAEFNDQHFQRQHRERPAGNHNHALRFAREQNFANRLGNQHLPQR